MNLRILVEELGLAEVARRLGVSVDTIRRWLRVGEIPAYAQTRLKRAWEDHERAKRGRETRERVKDFRDSLTTPPRSELPPELVKPSAPPNPLDAEGRLAKGASFFEYEKYRALVTTFEPNMAVLDVDWEEVVEQTTTTIRENPEYPYWRVVFIFFQYFADNPAYKGELLALRGTYKSFATSTETWELDEMVREAIDRANRKVIDSAQKRIKWLFQYQVHQSRRRED